jgi:hypothetical protein
VRSTDYCSLQAEWRSFSFSGPASTRLERWLQGIKVGWLIRTDAVAVDQRLRTFRLDAMLVFSL